MATFIGKRKKTGERKKTLNCLKALWKLLLNTVASMDRSFSPRLLFAHWLGHLPRLASSQVLIEYDTKGYVS